ncbi:hypothetical protein HZD82_27325, partial [Pantoea agglomerans]|nr:hypothetical protein [Pantoea agglomerans]
MIVQVSIPDLVSNSSTILCPVPTVQRKILRRLQQNNPHPTTELNVSSPFELLIAVLLSAQATDVSV